MGSQPSGGEQAVVDPLQLRARGHAVRRLPHHPATRGARKISNDCAEAVEEPTATEQGHVELFVAWMIDTRSASTATNKFKCLQQFFGYLVDEEEMARSPLERLSQPKTPKKLIPTVDDGAVLRLLGTCTGKSFLDLRDAALIRLLFDTGGRLAEVGRLLNDDVDLKGDAVTLRGKGDKHRVVPFVDVVRQRGFRGCTRTASGTRSRTSGSSETEMKPR